MTRTFSAFLWFSLVLSASVALYTTSNHVQELQQRLRQTNQAIQQERQSLHVMKAEWNYLSNPARIERLAQRHLTLAASSPQQIARLDDLSDVIPTRGEAMASINVESAPMANVRTARAVPPPQATPALASTTTSGRGHAKIASEHFTDHVRLVHTASATMPSNGDSIGNLLTMMGNR